MLYTLHHPNILRFLNWYETSAHLWVLLELMVGGSLLNLVRLEQSLPEWSIRLRAADIAAGLQCVHAAGVIYADLKPSNLLVDERGRCVLADFALARKIETEEEWHTKATGANQSGHTNNVMKRGSPYYMSPELFYSDGIHSRASDLYSFGCLLYELATGRPPFYDPNLEESVRKTIEDEPIPVWRDPSASSSSSSSTHASQASTVAHNAHQYTFTPQFQSLLDGLLCKDPAQRMTWSELRTHPWWTIQLDADTHNETDDKRKKKKTSDGTTSKHHHVSSSMVMQLPEGWMLPDLPMPEERVFTQLFCEEQQTHPHDDHEQYQDQQQPETFQTQQQQQQQQFFGHQQPSPHPSSRQQPSSNDRHQHQLQSPLHKRHRPDITRLSMQAKQNLVRENPHLLTAQQQQNAPSQQTQPDHDSATSLEGTIRSLTIDDPDTEVDFGGTVSTFTQHHQHDQHGQTTEMHTEADEEIPEDTRLMAEAAAAAAAGGSGAASLNSAHAHDHDPTLELDALEAEFVRIKAEEEDAEVEEAAQWDREQRGQDGSHDRNEGDEYEYEYEQQQSDQPHQDYYAQQQQHQQQDGAILDQYSEHLYDEFGAFDAHDAYEHEHETVAEAPISFHGGRRGSELYDGSTTPSFSSRANHHHQPQQYPYSHHHVPSQYSQPSSAARSSRSAMSASSSASRATSARSSQRLMSGLHQSQSHPRAPTVTPSRVPSVSANKHTTPSGPVTSSSSSSSSSSVTHSPATATAPPSASGTPARTRTPSTKKSGSDGRSSSRKKLQPSSSATSVSAHIASLTRPTSSTANSSRSTSRKKGVSAQPSTASGAAAGTGNSSHTRASSSNKKKTTPATTRKLPATAQAHTASSRHR